MVDVMVVLMVISAAEEMGQRHGGGRSAGTRGSCSRHGVVARAAEYFFGPSDISFGAR